MRGIHTQIALGQVAKAQAQLRMANKRLNVIKIMMVQFQVQCNALPVEDPVRKIVESFIKAVTDTANGVGIDETEESRVITR